MAFELSDLNPLKYVRKATDELGLTSAPPTNLANGPDGDRVRQAADAFYNEYRGMTPNRAPTIAAPDATDRGGQEQAMRIARGAALGEAPSAAESLLNRTVDQNVANQMGIAKSMQGGRPGLALAAGLNGAQRAVSASAADLAAMRANEQATGRSQLIEAANALRSGDVGERGQNAGIAAANAGNELQSRDIDNRMRLGMGNLMASSALAPLSAAQAAQQLQIQNSAANQTAIGGLAGPAAYLLKSDETTKKDIHASPEMADEFLRSLEPKTFSYKDPGAMGSSPGTHLGVIAQDLAGGTTTGPDGKKWISADVIGRVLAGLGRLNEKVEGQG